MKKRLLFLVLFVLSCFALVGCGTAEPGDKGPKGDAGVNGKSAFELAGEVGGEDFDYESNEDWKADLQGARGLDGNQGEPGADAPDGVEYGLVMAGGCVFQWEKETFEMTKVFGELPDVEEVTATGIDEIYSTGADFSNRLFQVDAKFTGGTYFFFETGGRIKLELGNSDYAKAYGTQFTEGKSYRLTFGIDSLYFPQFTVHVIEFEEIEDIDVERHATATGENEFVLVVEYESKFYAAITLAGTYFLVDEVHIVDGKVVDAAADMIMVKEDLGEGVFAIKMKNSGKYLNCNNSTKFVGFTDTCEENTAKFKMGNGIEGNELFIFCQENHATQSKQRALAFNYNNGSNPRISTYAPGTQYAGAKMYQAVIPA